MVNTAVIMATYNGEKVIKEQLDSIRQQTLPPTYVLMRDDGSTDSTVEFVENYILDYNLSGWSIQRNSQNLGWRLNFRELLLDVLPLKVDYVFFSDQDDTWFLDKNKRQVEVLEENGGIDVLSSDIKLEIRSKTATIPDAVEFIDSDKKISKYQYNTEYHNNRQGWTFAMRKSFVDYVMSYYKDGLILSHDNLMTGISSVLGTGYNLNQPLGIHIRHDGNASGNYLSLKHSNARHVQELELFASYYTILYEVMFDKQMADIKIVKENRDFYIRRVINAKKRALFRTVLQVITQWRLYYGMSSRIRDIIFIFKK